MIPEAVNADFSRPVLLDCEALPWLPSPLPGVARRLLDRVGGERARATSIVRYAPGSRFSAHGHPGGEEFLVLEGIFSDETGDFGPGYYVRNPVGTYHAPWSDKGCTIFVKLLQMDPDDRARVAIDTRRCRLPEAVGGLSLRTLHRFGSEHVALGRLAAGATRRLDFPGGGEILLLSGRARIAGRDLPARGWMRQSAGMSVALGAATDLDFWIKYGLPRTDGLEGMIS